MTTVTECDQCGSKKLEDYMSGIRCVDCHRVWASEATTDRVILYTQTHDGKGNSLIPSNNAMPTLQKRG